MRYVLFLCLCVMPWSVSAYIVIETDQSQPYETVPVEAPPGEARTFLGELTNYPIMYEVVSDEPFRFTAQVEQLTNRAQQPFTLLLVRQNDRGGGVREITRMNVDLADWQRTRDSLVGLSVTQSPQIAQDVEAGVYRLEISTPENAGKFLLHIGDQPAEAGYWDQLRAVRMTQAWFGQGILSMLRSSLVYYPVGIFILVFALYKTWQFRQRKTTQPQHVSD